MSTDPGSRKPGVEVARLERIAAAAGEVVGLLCALAEEQPGNPHDDMSARLYEIAHKIEVAGERR